MFSYITDYILRKILKLKLFFPSIFTATEMTSPARKRTPFTKIASQWLLPLSNLSRDNFRTLKSSLVVLHIKILNFLILFYSFHFPFTQTFFKIWLSFMQKCPQEMSTSEIKNTPLLFFPF